MLDRENPGQPRAEVALVEGWPRCAGCGGTAFLLFLTNRGELCRGCIEAGGPRR